MSWLVNGRAVRLEACALLGVLAACAGRSLAKALRTLAGPWWLAQSDPHPDCAQSASAAFHSVFPGPKEREALVFFKDQVLSRLLVGLIAPVSCLAIVLLRTQQILCNVHEWAFAGEVPFSHGGIEAAARLSMKMPQDGTVPCQQAAALLVLHQSAF